MNLTAICCTYNRPRLLGRVIECFQRQDYPIEKRRLVILDDCGQYHSQSGPGWVLHSYKDRWHSLGAKRNASVMAAIADRPDTDGLLVCDDDDLYLPWWFSACAAALERAEWCRPSLVLRESPGGFREEPTQGIFHGGWALRRDTFARIGMYDPNLSGDEDKELRLRLERLGISQADPMDLGFDPYYVYCDNTGSDHISWHGVFPQGYEIVRAKGEIEFCEQIPIKWDQEYGQLPVRRIFTVGPVASPAKDGKQLVQIIRPVQLKPGGRGPLNGMGALQRALRQHGLDGGTSWLGICPGAGDCPAPANQGALPWFWCWEDRHYAIKWDQKGFPWVGGPNLLFDNSRAPGTGPKEREILNAQHCRGMVVHTDWYRDLLRSALPGGSRIPRIPASRAPSITCGAR